MLHREQAQIDVLFARWCSCNGWAGSSDQLAVLHVPGYTLNNITTNAQYNSQFCCLAVVKWWWIMRLGAALSLVAAMCAGCAAGIWPSLIGQLQNEGTLGQASEKCRVLLHVGMFAAIGETDFYNK